MVVCDNAHDRRIQPQNLQSQYIRFLFGWPNNKFPRATKQIANRSRIFHGFGQLVANHLFGWHSLRLCHFILYFRPHGSRLNLQGVRKLGVLSQKKNAQFPIWSIFLLKNKCMMLHAIYLTLMPHTRAIGLREWNQRGYMKSIHSQARALQPNMLGWPAGHLGSQSSAHHSAIDMKGKRKWATSGIGEDEEGSIV